MYPLTLSCPTCRELFSPVPHYVTVENGSQALYTDGNY